MKLILLFAALFIAVGFSSARDKIKGGSKLVKKLFDHKSLSYDTSVYSPDRDVKFHLVVKVFNSTDYLMQPIKLNNASTLKNFDGQLNTKLIIHGWNAFRNDAAIVYPVKAFLQHDQDYNLITVDWRRGAIDINYFAAKDRVESTGKTVAKFINFLAADGGADFNNIHIVGFSLGAHVAGFCGKTLNGSLGAIYGLEPAQPGFSFKDDVKRLAFTDAKYVEVVHTSKLSFRNPLGHVDFYANGGSVQPNCVLDLWGDCSHPMAIHYFSEAINSKVGFRGRRCKELRGMTTRKCRFMDGTRYMAQPPEDLSEQEQQIYWFKTAREPPYALLESY